jgi:PQQ-like domain
VSMEERKLAELLHRIAPEPPRPVTVEQVAYRLVTDRQPRPRRSRLGREPRLRRPSLSRAWAPVAAAAAVVVIAGASVGIAELASSHHTSPSGAAPASSTFSSGTASSSPSQTSISTGQPQPGTAIPGAPWNAQLIDHQAVFPDSLVSADGSLYLYGNGTLDRIDPATGAVIDTAQYSPPILNPPVVVGNTVWVVSAYNGGNVAVLHGYDASTLAQTSSLQVPAIGPVASGSQGVLTSGPNGNLYVAAGEIVAVVNPATGQVTNRIQVLAGTASSVAVSPDGSRLYVGINSSGSFKLLVYDLPSDIEVGSSTLTSGGSGGNLVATSGGVWGTTGSGHSEWVWFAPGGNLNKAVQVGRGAGGGFAAYPSYSDGVVWVGGSGDLVCASPATGQVLATADIPADQGVAQFLASPVVADGQGYSYYQTDASQLTGLARVTPPTACTGGQGS